MELVTQSEFARRVGVSRQAIGFAVKRKMVDSFGNGKKLKIDFLGSKTVDYVNQLHDKKKSGVIKRRKKKDGDAVSDKSKKIEDDNGGNGGGHLSNDELKEKFLENPRFLTKSDVELLKTVEQVQSLLIKNKKDRNELVSREMIQRVFARLYAIEMKELRSIPSSASSEIASMCKVEDGKLILEIEDYLGSEILSALKSITKLLDDYLKKIGADGISN